SSRHARRSCRCATAPRCRRWRHSPRTRAWHNSLQMPHPYACSAWTRAATRSNPPSAWQLLDAVTSGPAYADDVTAWFRHRVSRPGEGVTSRHSIRRVAGAVHVQDQVRRQRAPRIHRGPWRDSGLEQCRGGMGTDHLGHALDEVVVPRDQVAAGGNAFATGEVAVLATGFLYQQHAGSQVPRLQAGFEIAVETRCRAIRQVERGRARAADVLGPLEEGAGHRQLRVDMLALAVRE